MAGLIHPGTGREINPNMSQEEGYRLFGMLNHKIEQLNAQLIQLGVLTEWLMDQIEASEAIELDTDSFDTFAEARFAEIRAQAEQIIAQKRAEALHQQAANAETATPEVDLNE